MAIKAGDKAPDFKVNDQEGREIRLSDFKGKKVVLYFYPKDMTPGCTAQACSLRDNYNYLMKSGYEVLGVSTDTEKLHRKFIEKEKLPFRLLADTDKVIHGLYGTWGEKSMYGRTYMGTLRKTFIINEKGIIEEIIEKVDTKNHAGQILKNVGSKSPASPKKAAKKKPLVAKAKPSTLKKTVRKVRKK
jgi:thioredoxin-dependent peroxiredoxin